jgi:hypothetical protein
VKQFIILESTTGRILRSGSCAEHDYDIQAQAGESIIPYTYISVDQNYIINGVPTHVAPTPEEEAVREEGHVARVLQAGIVLIFYELDKRLRVLEGAPVITQAQFKQGLKILLGL